MPDASKFSPVGPYVVTPDGVKRTRFDAKGHAKTAIQDQTTRVLDVFMSRKLNAVTLASNASLFDETITLETGHNVVAGEYLEFWEGLGRLQVEVTLVATNVISLAMPLDYPFSTDAVINRVSVDMNIDASSADVVFSFEPLGTKSFDITRTILVMTHTTAGDDGKFGGIAALTKGVFARAIRGSAPFAANLFNARTNGDLRARAYDLFYSDKAPAGTFGTSWRRTFNGSEKNGVVVRVDPAQLDRVEFIGRDAMQTLLSMQAVIQGHEVDES